ncbi:MAG: VWA domain-containing protein [Flavobacteriales bacterium]|nr:VWA domain-containing protein [Flavobacteriales bacterium]
MNRPLARWRNCPRPLGITDLRSRTAPWTRVLPLVLMLLSGTSASAQKKPLTRMLFVMDASNSMNAFWGNKPKINTARELLLKSLEELQGQPDLGIALRLYGHQTPIEPGHQDCDDTKLEVPFGENTIPKIRTVLEQVRCVGTTPIARSLQRSAEDFPPCKDCRNIIILITDGIEACDEDPCAVSRALQAKGIVLKPFVIGVGLDDSQKYSLRCVGNYYDASSPELFAHVLDVVVTQALNSTSAEIDLLAADGRPTETNVPVTLYDQKTGAVRYHLEHTLNDRGQPDTLSIDPVFTYRMVVHTIPPIEQGNVSLKPGIHNVIRIDAGQGTLELKQGSGMPDPYATPCIVRRKDNLATMHVQTMNTQERYLIGNYDLEVLTLPRLRIDNVRIDQSRTNTVQVPQPGVLNVASSTPGDGAVFLKKGSELQWVVDLDPTTMRDQFRLLPGDYQVLYRSRNAHRTELSLTRDITIQSGQSVTVNF